MKARLTKAEIAKLESSGDTNLYRVAGEQTRRADTVKARDAANRRANGADARRRANLKEAEDEDRRARRALANGQEDAYNASIARAASLRSRAEQELYTGEQERRRAQSITQRLAKIPAGNRALRREATRAARRLCDRRAAAERDRLSGKVSADLDRFCSTGS